MAARQESAQVATVGIAIRAARTAREKSYTTRQWVGTTAEKVPYRSKFS